MIGLIWTGVGLLGAWGLSRLPPVQAFVSRYTGTHHYDATLPADLAHAVDTAIGVAVDAQGRAIPGETDIGRLNAFAAQLAKYPIAQGAVLAYAQRLGGGGKPAPANVPPAVPTLPIVPPSAGVAAATSTVASVLRNVTPATTSPSGILSKVRVLSDKTLSTSTDTAPTNAPVVRQNLAKWAVNEGGIEYFDVDVPPKSTIAAFQSWANSNMQNDISRLVVDGIIGPQTTSALAIYARR